MTTTNNEQIMPAEQPITVQDVSLTPRDDAPKTSWLRSKGTKVASLVNPFATNAKKQKAAVEDEAPATQQAIAFEIDVKRRADAAAPPSLVLFAGAALIFASGFATAFYFMTLE